MRKTKQARKAKPGMTKPFVFGTEGVRQFDRPLRYLREAALKVRGLAYLIENHHDEPGTPLDFEDINSGIGLILTQCSRSILRHTRGIEERSLTTMVKRSSKEMKP